MSLFHGEMGPCIYPWGQWSWKGSLGVLWGDISIQKKREGISIQEKSGVNTSKSQSNGRKRGNKEKKEGGLVSVRRGMCKGGKVERGWGGENTQGSEEGHTHTHTHKNNTSTADIKYCRLWV